MSADEIELGPDDIWEAIGLLEAEWQKTAGEINPDHLRVAIEIELNGETFL